MACSRLLGLTAASPQLIVVKALEVELGNRDLNTKAKHSRSDLVTGSSRSLGTRLG